MTQDAAARGLLSTLEETLDLLQSHNTPAASNAPRVPLPNLLAQCQDQIARTEAARVPVRTLHHFACTGGTLIAGCLAAMPNTALLNEIDPLSKQHVPIAGNYFFPSDFLVDLLASPRNLPDRVMVAGFQAGIRALNDELARLGQTLVLRDHAHSHFCFRPDEPEARATLREILTPVVPLRSVLTIRHPLESYLSLSKNDWVHFRPATLEEYCRRYLLFLDRHDGLEMFRYEDVLRDPDTTLRAICGALDLGYSPDFDTSRLLFSLSGNSGRSGGRVAPRPPRDIPAELRAESAQSASFATLCERMGYPA